MPNLGELAWRSRWTLHLVAFRHTCQRIHAGGRGLAHYWVRRGYSRIVRRAHGRGVGIAVDARRATVGQVVDVRGREGGGQVLVVGVGLVLSLRRGGGCGLCLVVVILRRVNELVTQARRRP